MMWFEALAGFPEESPQQVRENITVRFASPARARARPRTAEGSADTQIS